MYKTPWHVVTEESKRFWNETADMRARLSAGKPSKPAARIAAIGKYLGRFNSAECGEKLLEVLSEESPDIFWPSFLKGGRHVIELGRYAQKFSTYSHATRCWNQRPHIWIRKRACISTRYPIRLSVTGVVRGLACAACRGQPTTMWRKRSLVGIDT